MYLSGELSWERLHQLLLNHKTKQLEFHSSYKNHCTHPVGQSNWNCVKKKKKKPLYM